MTTANSTSTDSFVKPGSDLGRRSHAAKKPSAINLKPFSVRGFTSMLLVSSVLMLLLSGVLLYIAPRGRVANWTSWTMLALSRQQWVALHINASLLFVFVTLTHLAMNWSRLVGYLKKRTRPGINMKRELAAAFAVSVAVFVGTTLELPPINIPVELKYELRDSWEPVVNDQSVDLSVARLSSRDRIRRDETSVPDAGSVY